MPNITPREETASIGSHEADVRFESRPHSSMNRKRKAKGRDDFVHFLLQVHRTEIRRVTDKVAMTEVQKAHQNFLVEVGQGLHSDCFVQTSRKEVAKGEIHVILGMLPNVQNSKLQVDADSETSVHTNTTQHADEKTISHRLRFTFHRMMNDRSNYGNFSGPNCESDFVISRTCIFSKKENLGPTIGVIQGESQNP